LLRAARRRFARGGQLRGFVVDGATGQAFALVDVAALA
jgi:hypothetical protein